MRPHAVATVIGPSATLNYTYDANGNMLTGAGRTVTWTSFNMAYQISQGTNTLTYLYDADHARIKETGPNGTTIYINPRLDLGGHFEKITKPDGSIEYKHYLYAGGQSIGVYTSRSTGVNDTRYFHTDHLGSVAVVTNETGAVVARFSYDPFGNRTTVSGDATVTHHGFTGHETMVEVGLVNMNGRIYDPQLARFMSADPNIQAPGNGQSFNRYSYVLNNPLSMTDPSGYSWLSKTWKKLWNNPVVRVVAAVVASAYTFGAVNGLFIAGGSVTASATAGFVAGGIMGGDMKSAVQGGVTGGIFGTVTYLSSPGEFNLNSYQKIGANAVTGGTTTKMQGGRFEDGFKSEFLTSSASSIYKNVVGYTANPLPGGDAVQKGFTSPPVDWANNIGTQGGDVLNPSFWAEGGAVSKILNYVPGINAVAGIHDQFQINLEGSWRNALNIPGMLPASVITYYIR